MQSERRNELENPRLCKVENQVRPSGLQADSGAGAGYGERREGGLSRLCRVWASPSPTSGGVEFWRESVSSEAPYLESFSNS